MVRFNSDRGHCRPAGVPSNNDDSSRNERLAVTEGATKAALMQALQVFKDYDNIQACEISVSLDPGKTFRVTRTHPEVQEVHSEDFLKRQLSRASVDAVEGDIQEATASGGRQACGLPCASRHSRNPKRKKERGSNSPTPTSRKKPKPVRNSRDAINPSDDSESEDEIDELEGAEIEMRELKIRDVRDNYYKVAYRSISQLCCKDTVKAWIRVGQPRKQTTHPYNGGKSSRERSLAEYNYPGHYSMPDYWPSDENWQVGRGCRHREPDHVKKLERLILLVHLLRSEGKGYTDGDFSLDKLKQATANIHLECGKNWKPEYVDRLKEIYWVRGQEMKFELGEMDGETTVLVRMPKPRSKGRKAPKSSAKVTGSSSEQIKREPEETSSRTCSAPTANMGIKLQIDEDDISLSEVSEPSILADTSSSTEEVIPNASYPEPTLCKARATRHGLPFSDSLSPTDISHSSVKENWTSQSVNMGQDSTIFTRPNPFASVATPGEAQRSMPLHDQCYFGSSSMQTFPNQEFLGRQYDQESTASERVANRMRPKQTFTCSLPTRPVAPKVENIRHSTFAASSSGLVGAFPTDADYSSWQVNDLYNAQVESSMYTAVADPSISLLPSTNGSFSSGYSDASNSTGLQLDTWNGGNQGLMPYDEGLDEGLNLQPGNVPGYQALGINPSSAGNPDLANQFFYTTNLGTHTSMATEHKFDQFSRE